MGKLLSNQYCTLTCYVQTGTNIGFTYINDLISANNIIEIA